MSDAPFRYRPIDANMAQPLGGQGSEFFKWIDPQIFGWDQDGSSHILTVTHQNPQHREVIPMFKIQHRQFI